MSRDNQWPDEAPASLIYATEALTWIAPILLIGSPLLVIVDGYGNYAYSTPTPAPGSGLDNWQPLIVWPPFVLGLLCLYFRVGGR